MKNGERYEFIWADGGTVKYTVLSVNAMTVHIVFDNGSQNAFSIGSAMHLESKKI
jgi:hypothetical protein